MTYTATVQYVIVLLLLSTIASPVNAAIILNCKTEKRIDIAGCGYSLSCRSSDGQSVTNPFYHEQDLSGRSYKLYADKTKLMFIDKYGYETEWRNVPKKYDIENNQFSLDEQTSTVSASKAKGPWSSHSLTVVDGKEFYFIEKDGWHSRIEVGSCS